VQPRFARLQSGQQFEIKPPDKGILKQDLLFSSEIFDIEWRFGAARQTRAEIFRIEVISTGNVYVGHPTFDKAKRDHPVGHVLIRKDRSGVDIAAVDVEQR
jgi:hypothetical protein